MKKVSIIIPVYNAEKYIAATIESVLDQTFTNWELLLVDDCSTDDSSKVINKIIASNESAHKDKVQVILSEKNGGAALARNIGLSKAEGRYIAYLDADDLWFPDKLKKQIGFMEETGAAFSFTAYEFGDEEANGTGRVVSVPPALNYKKALSRTVIFTSTTLFDTTIIDKELLKMPDIKSEDTATWWQILRNGYTAYGLNEVTTIYRRPSGSLSSNKIAAVKRIWFLYRKKENLSLCLSLGNFIMWAIRATLRRI